MKTLIYAGTYGTEYKRRQMVMYVLSSSAVSRVGACPDRGDTVEVDSVGDDSKSPSHVSIQFTGLLRVGMGLFYIYFMFSMFSPDSNMPGVPGSKSQQKGGA